MNKYIAYDTKNNIIVDQHDQLSILAVNNPNAEYFRSSDGLGFFKKDLKPNFRKYYSFKFNKVLRLQQNGIVWCEKKHMHKNKLSIDPNPNYTYFYKGAF